ncbi:hypothetical protein [Rheinheimera baltica]|uniref:hypothetical protein n=1 Tax=Rheinheimera baltica TaxID=67576 RepID=UPI00273D266E|nr:hypothetical protein [Rheinheimera baltica]MDP5191719.1 hypothetical protein [Rheinheimera baltica]
MNSSFQRVSADSLPVSLTKALLNQKVLKCFHSPELQRYVIWIVNDQTKRQQELEFDEKAACFLSRDERASLLDAPFDVEYKDLNVKVKVSYLLEAETDVLHEELTVYGSLTGKPVISAKYVVFNAFKTDRKKEVAKLVEKASFPMQYSAWTQQEKVNYWSEQLYRIRRHAGEDGASLDSVFNAKLIEHMTSIDANILNLLPEILVELAKMEMTAANSIFAAFTARTQIDLAEPA